MKAKHWKTISSTEILQHPRMHLVEDTVELPDSKVTTYLRHAPAKAHAVAIIAINDKQEMLLQREYAYPLDEIIWQLPGGGMFEDESVSQAANRELSEESGLAADSCKQIGFYYMDTRRSDIKQYVVVCTGLRPKAGKRDAEEFIETHWLSIDKVKAMIKAGEFTHAFLLAALNLYFATVWPG